MNQILNNLSPGRVDSRDPDGWMPRHSNDFVIFQDLGQGIWGIAC